jgi:taurine dioxygenase
MQGSLSANGEGWHSDVSCEVEPPRGGILHIEKCPPRGGDTLFATMYAAYDALSDRMKMYLEGMTARHGGEHVYRGLFKNYGLADTPSYPRAEHPVVRTHPVTGKNALYMNAGFTRSLVGVPQDESDGILRHLHSPWKTRFSSAASAGVRTRSPSRTIAASSIARCGLPAHTRSGHRVTVKGDRPFQAACDLPPAGLNPRRRRRSGHPR